jgi:hypothetical protein
MKNKSAPAYAAPQTIAGYKVYPCAYGHIHWLTERKNPIMTQKGNVDDYALAEICFAFTTDPKSLQAVKGAQAKARVTTFLMESTSRALVALWTHASKEIELYFSSMTVPKKAPAQASKSRKPATRARKR